MISIETARKLKQAGLAWKPQRDDCFIAPDRGMDDTIFVLNNMTIQYEILQGHPAITFNGATEWALDYIFQVETLWLPREEQLRALLENTIKQINADATFCLTNKPGGYLCIIDTANGRETYEGNSASDAYAEALFYLYLQKNKA